MRFYSHKQPATLLLWLLALPIPILVWWMTQQAEGRSIAVGVFVVLALIMVLFASLTVEVSETDVRLAFGAGLIRKRFGVSDIVDARVVTNPWYYGWGIHLTPHGWLFNVSGSQAVELDLKSGRQARIGTDEPTRLLEAVRQAMRSPRPGDSG